LTEGVNNPDQIQFFDAGGATLDEPAAAEGAFVVVSDDVTNLAAGSPANTTGGLSNGRIYRLGTKRDDLGIGIYELAPGWDMTYVAATGSNENVPARPVNVAPVGLPATAILVGRGYADPALPYDPAMPTPNGTFEGGVQDISVYTSFVPAN
jgi:hypothetical protein